MKIVYTDEDQKRLDDARLAVINVFDQLFKAYLDVIPMQDDQRIAKAIKLTRNDAYYKALLNHTSNMNSAIFPKYFVYENAKENEVKEP